MSDPIPVITRIINADNGSSRSGKLASNAPEEIQLKSGSTIARPSGDRPASFTADATDTTNNPTMTATAIDPDQGLVNRRPTAALIRNPTRGNAAMESSITK